MTLKTADIDLDGPVASEARAAPRRRTGILARESRSAYAFVTPAFCLLGFLVAYPFVLSVWFSLSNARIGTAQLEALPRFLATRRALAGRYFERFRTQPACHLPPRLRENDGQTWNMFSVLLPLPGMASSRQEFRAALDAEGIGTGVSYEALHLSTLGRGYGYRDGDFPVTERIARETVTLPLHAAMTVADVDRVCAAAAAAIAPPRA